ncbi:MAG: hypothetical protein SPL06_06920 [Bacteroidales bacterium]|nr:hypothetical protein [Bacteroidales bacterium]
MLTFKEFTMLAADIHGNLDNTIAEDNKPVAVVAFGRFQPPTLGHLKLMDTIVSIAKKYNGKAMLFLSHSQDPKKNPLPYETKYNFVKKAAPTGLHVVHSQEKNIYTIMPVLGDMGYKKVVLVVGDDRVEEFKKVSKYMKDFKGVEEIEVVSAGARKNGTDVNNVENISASLLRKLAGQNDKETFMKGCIFAKKSRQDAENLYKETRNNMGLKENQEMTWEELNMLLSDHKKAYYGIDTWSAEGYAKGNVELG